MKTLIHKLKSLVGSMIRLLGKFFSIRGASKKRVGVNPLRSGK